MDLCLAPVGPFQQTLFGSHQRPPQLEQFRLRPHLALFILPPATPSPGKLRIIIPRPLPWSGFCERRLRPAVAPGFGCGRGGRAFFGS